MTDTEILQIRQDTADHLRQTLLEEVKKIKHFINYEAVIELIKKKCV